MICVSDDRIFHDILNGLIDRKWVISVQQTRPRQITMGTTSFPHPLPVARTKLKIQLTTVLANNNANLIQIVKISKHVFYNNIKVNSLTDICLSYKFF